MSGGFRSRSKGGDSERKADGRKQYARDAQRGSLQRNGKNNSRNSHHPRGRRGAQEKNSFVQAARRSGVDTARAVSFEVLRRVHSDDAFANLTLPKALRVHKLEGRDAAFATELTYEIGRAHV